MEHQIVTSISSSTSSTSSSTLVAQPLPASFVQRNSSAGSSKQLVKNSKGVAKKAKKVVVKKTEEVAKKAENVVVQKTNAKHFIKERPKLPPPPPPPPPPERRNPVRGPRVIYTEMVVPDDDHFLCE